MFPFLYVFSFLSPCLCTSVAHFSPFVLSAFGASVSAPQNSLTTMHRTTSSFSVGSHWQTMRQPEYYSLTPEQSFFLVLGNNLAPSSSPSPRLPELPKARPSGMSRAFSATFTNCKLSSLRENPSVLIMCVLDQFTVFSQLFHRLIVFLNQSYVRLNLSARQLLC